MAEQMLQACGFCTSLALAGSRFEATYSITIDPNVTSANLPRDGLAFGLQIAELRS